MQNNDSSPPPGVVELREDVPLKGGAGGGSACGGGGPRLIAGCFAALSAAVAVALLTQIYYGDYQVVPHGAVATGAQACSAAGAGALKAGGRAADAAAAAALCLALLTPHRTSIDASGALVYWEYRTGRAAGPQLAEWGGPEPAVAEPGPGQARAPRLLAALADLHAARGALAWRRVLQPTVDLARSGFVVTKAVAAAAAGAGAGAAWAAGSLRADPAFADYLESLQRNTSAELSAAWSAAAAGAPALRWRAAPATRAGGWALWAGGARAGSAASALAAALAPPPADQDDAERRVVEALVAATGAGGAEVGAGGGAAAGLAVVDPADTYLALVTGLSRPFGSLPPWGAAGAAGAAAAEGAAGAVDAASAADARDDPAAPLDVAPAILVDGDVCGTRYVLGAESSSALAQAAAALATATPGAELAAALERPRAELQGGAPTPGPPPAPDAAPAPAAVNAVQQRGDTLASHADSRGGGLASRF